MKNLTKACLMSAAVLIGAGQAQAARENDAATVSMTQNGQLTGGIKVISTDGKTWNEIESSAISIPTKIFIKNPSGYVVGYKIGIMGPIAAHEVFTPDTPQTFQKTMTLHSTGGTLNYAFKSEIIEMCNAQLSRGKGLAETHTLSYEAGVNMTAWIGWADVDDNTSVGKRMDVTVPVKCIKSENIAPYEIVVAVTQHGETCPKETRVTTVIKYRYPAVSRYRFRMDSKLSQLRTMTAARVGPKPMPGIPGGGANYIVSDVKTYHLDPGRHTFRVETRDGTKSNIETSIITCPQFKVTQSWLKYKVQNKAVCPKNVKEVATFKATQPGSAPYEIKTQGGLVVNSGTAIFKRKGMEYVAKVKRTTQMSAFESLMSARITDPRLTSAGSGSALLKVECLEYSGDFSFMDNTGTRCPREGKALVNFSMNIKKNIHFTLACSNGNFSGVAKAIPDNNGGFVAPALVKFNINQTTHANCRLSSVVGGQTKNHTFKGHVFNCIKRTTDPVTDDLSGGANPTPGGPTTPGVIVADPFTPPTPPVNVVPGIIADPVRTVSCAGGIVRNRSCYCPRTDKKLSAGPNAWRCVGSVVSDPVRTNPTGGTPGANTDTGPVGGAPGTGTGADTNSAGGKPTRTNPATANTSLAKPDVEKRRLEELKKKKQAQKKAAAAAKKKAASAKKKAVAAKKKAAVAAKKKAAAVAKRKAAAAAAKRKAAAATAARRQSAATAAKRSNKKRKKKGKKRGKRTIAQ